MTPKQAWIKRLKLLDEGDIAYAKSRKLLAESRKLYAEGDKLYSESDKLYSESRKLYAESYVVFLNTVIAKYGNIELEWTNDGCKLANGVEFKNK